MDSSGEGNFGYLFFDADKREKPSLLPDATFICRNYMHADRIWN
jgi:hypothetical protein